LFIIFLMKIACLCYTYSGRKKISSQYTDKTLPFV
jgi:hypothetical protein